MNQEAEHNDRFMPDRDEEKLLSKIRRLLQSEKEQQTQSYLKTIWDVRRLLWDYHKVHKEDGVFVSRSLDVTVPYLHGNSMEGHLAECMFGWLDVRCDNVSLSEPSPEGELPTLLVWGEPLDCEVFYLVFHFMRSSFDSTLNRLTSAVGVYLPVSTKDHVHDAYDMAHICLWQTINDIGRNISDLQQRWASGEAPKWGSAGEDDTWGKWL